MGCKQMFIIRGTVNWLKGVLRPFTLMKENSISLISFEIIFRILTFLVLFPIMTWTQRLWLIGNKTKVIAWYNAGSFVRNPLSWLVLLAMVLMLVAATMFEQFAIYDTLHASRWGKRKTVRQIFSTGFDMCVERLRLENWGLIPYVIFVMRFGSSAIADISSITSVIRIPGFILEDFHKRPWEGNAYRVLVIILTYFFVRWLFAIPIMMEEDSTSFGTACRKSAAMISGKYFFRILILTACWGVFCYAIFGIGTFLIVTAWYLLSMWVIPGETDPFITFVQDRIFPVGIIFYICFLWVMIPLMMASFQSAYYKRKSELKEPVLKYTDPPHFFHRYPVLKYLVLAVCAVSIYFSVPRRFAQIRWMLNTEYGTPMIMAHRGFSAEAPENTLPAFQKCIDGEISAAELDVQMLKDGTIIVLHDDNFKRTTGLNKNVWEVTYDEIRDLDNGRFFSEEYAGTKIPTLEEVIRLAGSGKDKLYLNIEIKRNGHDDGITQKVVDIIEDNDYLGYCDVTSQDYRTLEEIREINPSVLTAYTSAIGIGNIESLDAADIISIQETFATYENIDRIHRAGKHVFVWTVNEQDTMEKLVSLNVDAILTNDPTLCQVVIADHSWTVMSVIRRIESVFLFI